MQEVIIDALIDSLKVLGFAFVIYFILSFLEDKISKLLQRHHKTSPIFASLAGLIPQCGISVVASDLYIKEHITIGTLFAVFFSCSDEALPILFSDLSKAIYIIPLLLTKFVFGFGFGYLLDLFIKKSETKDVIEDSHVGCCHHSIEEHDEKWYFSHLIHPLIHSFKIFCYVLVVNLLFGTLIYFVGEDNIKNFLISHKYLSPLICSMVGLVPNCASSVLMTELFLLNGLPFGALLTGLCINAGLGLIYLLKSKKDLKNTLILIGYLILTAIFVGYMAIIIEGAFIG